MWMTLYAIRVTVPLLSLISCIQVVKAISGGVTVQSADRYPFSVTLTKPILCGGAIISLDPAWILTAAHCIEDLGVNDEEKQSVAYGDNRFGKQSYASIKRAVIHPLYISSQQFANEVYEFDRTEIVPYDIGLIQLVEPLVANRYVNRIPIYTSNVKKEEEERRVVHNNDTNINGTDTDSLETIGMGYLGIGQPRAEILQSTKCTLSASNYLKDNNYNNSVILTTSDAGLCHGDSGNPLLYRNDQNKYYLRGVLNRIFNAYDPDPNNFSCPLHENNATSFVNSFVKPSAHFKWIMKVTQLSKDALTKPMSTADVGGDRNNIHTYSTSDAAAAMSMSSLFTFSLPLLSIFCIISA